MPALEVAMTPPIVGMKRQSIEDRAQSVKGLLSGAGLICFLLSILCAWASRFSIFWGFISAFGMTLAFALLTPSLLFEFAGRGGLLIKRAFGSLSGFLAARMIQASLSRTGISVAALAVALSMTVGVDTMIHSFRYSVKNWLEGSLQGDLYISPATTKWAHPLPDGLVELLNSDPDVEALERYSTYEVYLEGKPLKLRVIEADTLRTRARFTFLQSEAESPWQKLKQGEVFISEPLAYRFKLVLGGSVDLMTPNGKKSFRVSAITRDYSSDQGTIQIDRAIYEQIWKDYRVQSIAIFAKPGASLQSIREKVVSRFAGLDRSIVSNRRMKQDILAIFDKTFAPTATLKGVSLLVALLGVATALTAILIERSRDMVMLGFLGLRPAETGKINVYQALIMGLTSFVIAAICGLFLTVIIIYAINYRSFGWSIDVYLSPWIFVKLFLLTAAACLAASAYPTWRLMKSGSRLSFSDE